MVVVAALLLLLAMELDENANEGLGDSYKQKRHKAPPPQVQARVEPLW